MKKYKCINCNKECSYGVTKINKFCSNYCQREFEFVNKTLVRFEEGKISERNTLRKVLIYLHNDICKECGISEWQEKPITLEVDHVDGNAGNNFPGNLRLLCPNCHSQTSTFKGRNKGKGRGARGINLK